MWIWSRMFRIKIGEIIGEMNMCCEREVEEERKLMDAIKGRQRKWMGHVLRGESLLKDNGRSK